MDKQLLMNVVRSVACADAFAMPLMSRPPKLIKEDLGHGSFVTDLIDVPADSPGYPLKKGDVSDVFAASYCLLDRFLDEGISRESAIKGILDYKYSDQTKKYFEIFGSNTDKLSLSFIEGVHVYDRFDKVPCEGRRISNEAAARAWVAGLLNGGNVEKAVEDALVMSEPTHGNAIAMSGAAVVAALVAAALGGEKDLGRLYDLALTVAEKSYDQAQQMIGVTSVGSKLVGRIRKAASIALKYSDDPEKVIENIHDVIGVGSYTSEVVPSAIGLLIASGGDIEKGLYLAANAGNNSNKTAVIVVSILAAMQGKDDLVRKYQAKVDEVAHFDLKRIEDRIGR